MINEGSSISIDVQESLFNHQDYQKRKKCLIKCLNRPIFYLKLKLLFGVTSLGNTIEILSEAIKIIYYVNNVKMYSIHLYLLDLDLNNITQLTKDKNINKNSILEKLKLNIGIDKIKPKDVIDILRVFAELPKLETIEVKCYKKIYNECNYLKSIKGRNEKKVSCNFINTQKLI